MLEEITIRNFAVMDDASVEFGPGMTAVTGETGAGKSILVNAVGLLLGARATSRMIRQGAAAAELTARFRPPDGSEVARRLSEASHDLCDGLVIQRIIAANDRHKVYVNGRPSTMGEVAAITEGLAGISGQHAHQALLKPESHLAILDDFGGLVGLREKVRAAHRKVSRAWEDLKALKESEQSAREQKELYAFQAGEIDRARISPGEDEALETERARLKNAEALYRAAHESEQALYSAPGSAAELLGGAAKALSAARQTDPGLAPAHQGVDQALILVQEAAGQLRDYLAGLDMDEGRLDEVEDRLHLLSGLKRKYGPSLADVLEYRKNLEDRLSGARNRKEAVAEAEKALAEARDALASLCKKLSAARKKAAADLEARVEAELKQLAMAGASFSVRLAPAPAPADPESPFALGEGGMEPTGAERAAFFIAPNVGEGQKPLREIASGGELSRVVLALKVILAEKDGVRTVIFDEVDAGIGGAAADVVGEKLARLAATHQVICITHLPQIARFADAHVRVEKAVEDGRTRSRLTTLDHGGRVEELARMLAGGRVTETSRKHAAELLATGTGSGRTATPPGKTGKTVVA
ncbi:MAG: DNA repair protein RecN [Deltaproteobacteria bacterium]|nr:DNA repair protein RecN [Deltaproteobacteria bacterium]